MNKLRKLLKEEFNRPEEASSVLLITAKNMEYVSL